MYQRTVDSSTSATCTTEEDGGALELPQLNRLDRASARRKAPNQQASHIHVEVGRAAELPCCAHLPLVLNELKKRYYLCNLSSIAPKHTVLDCITILLCPQSVPNPRTCDEPPEEGSQPAQVTRETDAIDLSYLSYPTVLLRSREVGTCSQASSAFLNVLDSVDNGRSTPSSLNHFRTAW